MPLKNIDKMELKLMFIRDYISGKYTFTSLCEDYGISRQTGYNYRRYYELYGVEGLQEKSRSPCNPKMKVTPFIREKVKELRNPKGRSKLGARTIRAKLLSSYPDLIIPSASTIHNVLLSEGLIIKKRKRRRLYRMNTKNAPDHCNDIWTIDYKGHFKMGNGRRCHPLTVCDSKTRCLLLNKGHYRETVKNVKEELIRLFLEYGQPNYLLSDNGSCFASPQSPCGYGSLSYWLIEHGVYPLFSDPGCPGQNGRHERMHRDLKAYCCYPACKDLRSQNRRLNDFKRYYNNDRPHHALEMCYPGDLYTPSKKKYRKKVESYEYGPGFKVERVNKGGSIRWGSEEWLMLSQGLVGKEIALRELGENAFEVYFRDVNLGFFEPDDKIIRGRYYRLTSERDLPSRKRTSHKHIKG